ncbi:MAG TPA: L-arabinose isomerase, partial [Clostridiales bacterium]|nr:L-arabinose isomerase [Clostridiales bacterium]
MEHTFWFITGSQHLYGPETLRQVKENSIMIARALDENQRISGKVVFKAVVTTAEEISGVIGEAGNDPDCAGIITWMHTFSPSQMWIPGLSVNRKPWLHFHTQFNRDIPWETIDMDFMNLNQ